MLVPMLKCMTSPASITRKTSPPFRMMLTTIGALLTGYDPSVYSESHNVTVYGTFYSSQQNGVLIPVWNLVYRVVCGQLECHHFCTGG
jgi:hypothetical protein